MATNQPGQLKKHEVIGVEHATESLCVRDPSCGGRDDMLLRWEQPGAANQEHLAEQAERYDKAERHIAQEALLQFDEIHVEHHHDEQEQHRDRADVNDHQQHREEFGAEQDEQARRVEEGKDQEQD
jgi:hypothetical protein